ncbi:MAG: hypothetical protein JOZ90_10685 [Alphaproteobacteria bacterium]|nr:hypothetical protein [Alphaproteobacteria bacterium]MBV9371076.1 hypothetical protein [Alphaproteobacteria bacterium]MBV9901550.1 hypothetical protein [Alphaproteobacteria bacterium]
MRWSLPILLFLAGCGARAPAGGDEGADPAAGGNDLLGNLAAVNDSNDPARLQALIDRAMPSAIPRAKDAAYRNLRGGAGGSVCGEVAPAGPKRVFLPFVITPDALAVVGTTPRIAYEDPNDFLADAWIRWCATPEELQKLAPTLQNAARAAGPAANEVSAAIPPPIDPSVVQVDPPPPPPPDRPVPAPPPAKPAPPPQIDSFFNSVQHRDR